MLGQPRNSCVGVPATDLRPVVLAGAVRAALVATLDRWSSDRAADVVSSFAEAFDILARLDTIGGRARRR